MKKIGIIGAGGISTGIHLPVLKQIGCEIICICDNYPGRAEKAAKDFKIPEFFTNYKEMLDTADIDGVFVLVEPDSLFRVASDCLEYGYDVFMEKPAGITLYQAEALGRISVRKGRILQVGFNRRHIPLIKYVVEKMKSITKINQIEGCFVKHSDAAFYGGCSSAFMCDTIHVIDVLSWIADSEPENAATVIARYGNSEVNNAWNSVIRFENGITGIIKANYSTGGRVHTFEIHGNDASAYINIGFGGAACEAKIIYSGGVGTYSLSAGAKVENNIELIDGISLCGSDRYENYYGYYYEDEEFLKAITERRKPLNDISSAIKTMRLAEFILSKAI